MIVVGKFRYSSSLKNLFLKFHLLIFSPMPVMQVQISNCDRVNTGPIGRQKDGGNWVLSSTSAGLAFMHSIVLEEIVNVFYNLLADRD